ncbi:MAG: response regulator [Verrucomicrobiota bacterium]
MAHILIVEDDPASARLLSLLLRKAKHTCVVATTLEEGRQHIFNGDEFDLLILDNRVGKTFGWELLEQIRNHFYFKDLPVLVYTAAGDRDSISKYVGLRVQNIRAKPYGWDVIKVEIEKAMASGWGERDFAPRHDVMERLQITEEEYFESLRTIEEQLGKSAQRLLALLSPTKEAMFLRVLNDLRSTAVNFGLEIILRTIREVVLAFREEDWSRAVGSIRMLTISAERLRVRRDNFESGRTSAKDRDEASPFHMEAPAPASDVASELADSRACEVPADFRDLAASFANSSTVEGLVRAVAAGTVPVSPWQSHIETLGRFVQWLAYLEPNDHEAVASHLRELPGAEEILRATVEDEARDLALRDLVGSVGVFHAAFLGTSLKWIRTLKEEGFPLRMEYLSIRQLLVASVVRGLASKIQRPINFEAVILLRFFGEWIFALRYPGVYGLMALEPGPNAFLKHADAFSAQFAQIVPRLQVPADFSAAVEPEAMERPRASSTVRLVTGLIALADLVCDATPEVQEGELARASRAFCAASAWEVLANEDLKLPQNRERYFEMLRAGAASQRKRVVRWIQTVIDAPAFTPPMG